MKATIPGVSRQQRTAFASLWVMGLCAIGWSALAADDAPPAKSGANQPPVLEKKAGAEYNNWFDVSVGGVFVGGDPAQFMRQHGLRKGAFGGVEDFHWEEAIGKKGLVKIDGRGLFDNHDYSIKLGVEHPDIGYVRAGYREFRTWYDGSGGYFPQNGAWLSLYHEELALDRGEAWFEAGLTLPDKPVFTVRYAHQFRNGQKDSLSWGDSNLTGGLGERGIVPSFWDIDEIRDIFEADVKHTRGKTDWGLGIRYELLDSNDSRNIHRRPGELPPATAAPGTDREVTYREEVDLDLFNVHAFTETRFNDKVWFTTGYSFTRLDTDLSGSRVYGADYDAVYDPLFARRQFHDEGFLNLAGGSQMNQYVMNLNLMLTPWDNFSVVPAVRVEKQDLSGSISFRRSRAYSFDSRPSYGIRMKSMSPRYFSRSANASFAASTLV